ncbi:hypothetical protein DFH28DRAFT_1185411 [Melampsora americana]|nr:hypothetical protein DFH28DRAFT_1185411 [Melampsora americana]
MVESRLMSEQLRHTRNNPTSELISVPNPERILFPRASRAQPEQPVRAESLLLQDLGSFVNPPYREALSGTTATSSLDLDQISVLSPPRPHATLPHPGRRSLPGAFDPSLSFAMSDNTAEGDVPHGQVNQAQGPTGQQSPTISLAQMHADTTAMRGEINELRSLLRDFMKLGPGPQSSQPRPVAPHDFLGESGSQETAVPVRPQVSDRFVSPSVLEIPSDQPMYTSTPFNRNPFLVAAPVTVSAIDPLRFRVSDFPEYKGKYGDVSAYRIWRHKVEQIFKVKGIVSDSDRFDILPLLLSNDPAAAWCRRLGSFEGHTWLSVMKEMESVVLPVDWLDKIKQNLRDLTMKPGEHMSAFCARGRVLQEAAGMEECSEESLAWAIVGGSTSLFRAIQQRDQIIKTSINPVSNKFSFAMFEQRACAAWNYAMEIENRGKGNNRTNSSNHGSSELQTNSVSQRMTGSARTALSPEESAARNARFIAYMRSVGLCPRCKTSCPKWLGGCTADANMTYIQVPAEFPKHPPYPPAKPAGGTSRPGVAGTTKPPQRRVEVAAVDTTEAVDVAAVGVFPDLGREDLLAYEQLLEKLQQPAGDDLVDAAENELDVDTNGH